MIGFWTSRPWWFNLQLVLSSNCPILVKEFQAQDLPRPQCSNSRLSVSLRFYVKSILIMIFKFFFRLWNVDFGNWFHVNLSGRKILTFPHCVTPFSNTTTPKKQSRIVLHQKHLFILEIVNLINLFWGFIHFFTFFPSKTVYFWPLILTIFALKWGKIRETTLVSKISPEKRDQNFPRRCLSHEICKKRVNVKIVKFHEKRAQKSILSKKHFQCENFRIFLLLIFYVKSKFR